MLSTRTGRSPAGPPARERNSSQGYQAGPSHEGRAHEARHAGTPAAWRTEGSRNRAQQHAGPGQLAEGRQATADRGRWKFREPERAPGPRAPKTQADQSESVEQQGASANPRGRGHGARSGPEYFQRPWLRGDMVSSRWVAGVVHRDGGRRGDRHEAQRHPAAGRGDTRQADVGRQRVGGNGQCREKLGPEAGPAAPG